MKKLFILLGVIMFSILGCSCKKGDELNYPISELSEQLNAFARSVNYSAEKEYPITVDLDILSDVLEKKDPYFVTIGGKTRDHYICGYVSKDIVKYLDKPYVTPHNIHFDVFCGPKNYFFNWTEAYSYDFFSWSEYPIIWYEIPKDEKIPLETKDKVLLLVLETVSITYTSLDGTVTYTGEVFYENQKLYNENWNEEKIYEKIYEIEDCLLITDTNTNDFLVFTSDYYVMINSFSFPLEQIDAVTYINVGDYTTVFKGEDLKEKHEYILDKYGNVLFKLEDVKYIFKKGE